MIRMKSQNIFLFFLVTFSFVISSCSRNPVTGKRMVSLMSTDGEQKIGAENDPAIVAQFGLYEDAKIQSFITKKGTEMGKVSHMPNQKFTFRLLDSPVVNAFALPGGYVYFTRGIMAHFNNEAEFAGVLGHEIGHVTGRHGAKQYTKQIFTQALLLGGIIVSPTFRQFSDVASQGAGLLLLKNSRDHESESDKLGVIYSSKIGYDAHEMADFFQTLRRLTEDAGADGIPTFLSTHPDPADRYENVHSYTEKVVKELPKKNYVVNRNEYLNLIDGIIYGEDPRQGYAENNVFYHPELKFQLPYPNGWQLNNTPTQVLMGPSDGKALMILTVAGENSLDAAFNAQVQKDQLQVVSKEGIKVNGMQAIAGTFLQAGQQGNIQILTYFIKYDKYIYKLHGLSMQADFNNYMRTFERNFSQFQELTDSSKINVEPTRVRIYTVKSNSTLKNVLDEANMPSKLHNQIAILNGMQLNDQLKSGDTVKILSGGMKI